MCNNLTWPQIASKITSLKIAISFTTSVNCSADFLHNKKSSSLVCILSHLPCFSVSAFPSKCLWNWPESIQLKLGYDLKGHLQNEMRWKHVCHQISKYAVEMLCTKSYAISRQIFLIISKIIHHLLVRNYSAIFKVARQLSLAPAGLSLEDIIQS